MLAFWDSFSSVLILIIGVGVDFDNLWGCDLNHRFVKPTLYFFHTDILHLSTTRAVHANYPIREAISIPGGKLTKSITFKWITNKRIFSPH